MGMFDEFNKDNTASERMSVELSPKCEWKSLVNYAEDEGCDELPIKGMMFYTSEEYGKGVAVCVDEDLMLRLPTRYVEKFEGLSPEAMHYIQEGKATLTNISVFKINKGKGKGKKSVSFNIE